MCGIGSAAGDKIIPGWDYGRVRGLIPVEACRRACNADRVVAGRGSTDGWQLEPAEETVGSELPLPRDETNEGEPPVLTGRETSELGGGIRPSCWPEPV